ncbi:malto-oligosyltrehalose trehalohydrolase [Ravibacter arvi]|uniref:Malto-oligosyltrehalose trehalohydrolase n=1 Tax=Ravibacter arvi TaxID=2051041 RepID=A0ABP8LQ56_9BACT
MLNAGSYYRKNGSCLFRVWAPFSKQMTLHLVFPDEREIEMIPKPEGYFIAEVEKLPASTLYFYNPDGEADYPDPASQFQPKGVHGPSKVVDHHTFAWTDHEWKGIPLQELVLYELHVGTFTPEGTFEAIIPRLETLKSLGVNALELLPVAQFPENRNWGYDAVYPYAVQDSYGGPEGLKKLVDAAHQANVAIFLDVVYNHLGPEGNYLGKFGPYFTDHYRTPWGDAINFDGDYSDPVRAYIADNILYWAHYFHVDGLRLDAIHEIYDRGAVSIWELIHKKLKANPPLTGNRFYLIAESDLNSPRVVQPPESGGHGLDAQWLDDFHHALYVLLDKKGRSRYADFGTTRHLQKAYEAGFVHSGEYVGFRRRRYGRSSAGVPGERFIVFNQNHDQVGNRVNGERLSVLVDFDHLKLAMGALLTAPYIPMLFMGEEYGEDVPFYYFVSHSDQDLINAVSEGRKSLLAAFSNEKEFPDPVDLETFRRSKIDWEKRRVGRHKVLWEWTERLLHLRRTHPALKNFNKDATWTDLIGNNGLALYRAGEEAEHLVLALLNFSEESLSFRLPDDRKWGVLLNSADLRWQSTYQEGGAHTAPPEPEQKSVRVKPLQFILLDRYAGEHDSR